MNKVSTINIIANAALGPFFSGGDNIFIKCAKRWAQMGHKINIFVWEEGLEMCQRNYLTGVNYIIWPAARFKKFGFFILYFSRVIIGCMKSWKYHFKSPCIIYSASDFWPDSIPAFMMKIKNKKARWIAGFYLFAPKPWQKDSPYRGKRFLKGLFYWLMQLPTYWLVNKYADMVFVTSEPDVRKFVTKKRNRNKIVVIRGGVDIKPSTEYPNSGNVIPVEKRKYDAVFVGRFHPQKGVLELIDIWKLVCKKKPQAKLAMIGNGSLEKEVKEKIEKFGLQDNIESHGFRDREEKYDIFKQSKIVLHPATYDSGGMAAAEAMAWGLPGVSFDLESLKTYYPKGMIKVAQDDYGKFAEEIIKLLSDKDYYLKLSNEARNLIVKEWDWSVRAKYIYDCIIKNIGEKAIK
ncbi:MAG: glycosyltransferase [bacterium]